MRRNKQKKKKKKAQIHPAVRNEASQQWQNKAAKEEKEKKKEKHRSVIQSSKESKQSKCNAPKRLQGKGRSAKSAERRASRTGVEPCWEVAVGRPRG